MRYLDPKSKLAVTVLGEEAQGGAYVLRMHAPEPLAIHFGRFRKGEPVALAAGEYVYIGSAMGARGASSLARRLVRHATRRQGPPHEIREVMLAEFTRLGLGSGDLRPRGAKRLFWHVDYMLEAPEVRLTHVLAVRSGARLEEELAAMAAAQAYRATPAAGLGASDVPGGTHLFAVQPGEQWWQPFVARLHRQW